MHVAAVASAEGTASDSRPTANGWATWTAEGSLYVAAVINLFSRRVVGEERCIRRSAT
jgi:hypothetical protein